MSQMHTVWSSDAETTRSSLDRVENAVRLRLECLDEEWRVRAAPRRWARLRFHTAMKQQRTLDDIANRLCPDGTNSVVAFGNARFNASMKGQMPGPASKIRRHLIVKKKGRVVLVDEFQTSKKCSWCTQIQGGSVLRHPRMASWKDGVGLHVKNVYELCQCTTCYRTWNRDVNAARNIWMAFHGEYTNGVRPQHIRRPPPPPPPLLLLLPPAPLVVP